MYANWSPLCKCVVVTTLATTALAQKVKVGYDKSVDFSRYKTYTWAQPEKPPTRPFLYATVVGSIQSTLSSKGLQRVDKNGDLTLIGACGVEYGNNVAAGTPIISAYMGSPPAINATMWTGTEGGSALMAPYVPQGTLILEFVDRSANQVVWTGSVAQKLDVEKKEKSLQLVDKAIMKLLKEFPPKTSASK